MTNLRVSWTYGIPQIILKGKCRPQRDFLCIDADEQYNLVLHSRWIEIEMHWRFRSVSLPLNHKVPCYFTIIINIKIHTNYFKNYKIIFYVKRKVVKTTFLWKRSIIYQDLIYNCLFVISMSHAHSKIGNWSSQR